MAGYPKIWTTILDEPWFICLSGLQRGVFLQLLLEAKRQGDDGYLSYRSYAGCGQRVGVDRGSLSNTLRVFQHEGIIEVVEKTPKILRLHIPKYKKYQGLKNFKEIYERREVVKSSVEKPATPDPTNPNEPKNPPKPTNPTKHPKRVTASPSKAKKNIAQKPVHPDHQPAIAYWCAQYRERFGVDYDFQRAKDGAIVSRLINKYGLDTWKLIVDSFLSMDNDFLRKKGGWTLGVLSPMVNKIMQRLNAKTDKLDGYSETTRHNLRVAKEWVEEQNAKE